MKIEDQVCNRQQSERLKELGISIIPAFIHCRFLRDVIISTQEKMYEWDVVFTNWHPDAFKQYDWFAAFAVAELGVMLPEYYESHRGPMKDTWYCGKLESGDGDWFAMEPTQAKVLAAMLIHLLETKETTPEEVNKRFQ